MTTSTVAGTAQRRDLRSARASGQPTVNIHLPADSSSPARARSFVEAHLQASGLPDLADVGVLLVSELATNAILHAGTPFDVELTATPQGLRARVTDESDTTPVTRAPSTVAEGGRGLFLVAALASRWGVEANPSGKSVWFELRATPEEDEFG